MYQQLSILIAFLSMVSITTSLDREINSTSFCEEVRQIYLDQGTYNGTYNLDQLVCGKKYVEGSLPALRITTNLTYCMAHAAGYETSKTLPQWADPMFMFLVPAFAFTIGISKPIHFFRKVHNKPVLIRLLYNGILAWLDAILWGIMVFILSGPLIAASLHEIAIDHFILVQVQRNLITHSDMIASGANTYALAFTLIGSFKLDTGLSKAIDVGLKVEKRKDRAAKLHQLSHLIPSFNDIIVGPVIFYLGVFVWTLIGVKEKVGDNDLAHGTAFGIWYGVIVITAITCSATLGINKAKMIEGIFPPTNEQKTALEILGKETDSLYKSAWIWFKHHRFQKWIDHYYTQQLSNYPKGVAKRILTLFAVMSAAIFVSVPCILAMLICYWTPTVGFSCRSVTVMVYLAAQLILIIAWYIDVVSIDNQSSVTIRNSVKPMLWLLVSTAISLGLISVIGGTAMQLAGVYRNCICEAGLKYAFNYTGGLVDLATDTQQDRDNWSVWWRNGLIALSFFAFVLIVAAMHEIWMKEKFKHIVKQMMEDNRDMKEKDDEEITSPLVHHNSGLEE